MIGAVGGCHRRAIGRRNGLLQHHYERPDSVVMVRTGPIRESPRWLTRFRGGAHMVRDAIRAAKEARIGALQAPPATRLQQACCSAWAWRN
jgi:hypothetical protein